MSKERFPFRQVFVLVYNISSTGTMIGLLLSQDSVINWLHFHSIYCIFIRSVELVVKMNDLDSEILKKQTPGLLMYLCCLLGVFLVITCFKIVIITLLNLPLNKRNITT